MVLYIFTTFPDLDIAKMELFLFVPNDYYNIMFPETILALGCPQGT
jgi:hypothetical protein